MALSPSQRDRLIRAEQVTRAQVRDRIVAYAVALWTDLGSWRDSDIDRFVDLLVPRVMAGELTVARLTDAYLSQMVGVPTVGAVDLSNIRNGVTPDEVYRRPAVEMRTALSEGATLTAALAASSQRLQSLIRTDLQLANTHQARAFGVARDVRTWQRTLTGAENCGLCVVASTQRYYKGDLQPIHPGCDCGTEPLPPEQAENQVINPERLEELHEAVANKFGTTDRGARNLGMGNERSDFLDLIVTQEHGEYGPTLTWRGDKFTGPDDLS